MLDLMFRGFLASLSLLACAIAQGAPSVSWQEPSGVIKSIVTAPGQPSPSLSPQGTFLVMTTRESLPDLEVVARPHLKLAGMRIDGKTWSRQLSTKTTKITVQNLREGTTHTVPITADHWSGPYWSADDRAFALIRNTEGGGELWIADPYQAPPTKVLGLRLNQVLGGAVQWLPDQNRLLVRSIVDSPAPERPLVPEGPIVQQTRSGQKAQVRTYQDLLQDGHDENLLEYYGTSRLAVVDAADLSVKPFGTPAMYARASTSPDGSLILVDAIERPFSFVVPVSRFPRRIMILDFDGRMRRELHKQRLNDAVPIGGVAKGPRRFAWMQTAQHALYWSEAQDDGNPKNKVAHRDYVFALMEPEDTAHLWYKTEFRAGGVQFSGDGKTVLTGEADRQTRTERVWQRDLGELRDSGKLVYERSMQDVYGDPGRVVMERTLDGRTVMRERKGHLYLSGNGASPAGNRPFLDQWDLEASSKIRVFEAADGRHETFVGFVGPTSEELMIRSETRSDPPSLVYLNTQSGVRREIYKFEDPAAKWTKLVKKQLVRYEREDGVPMNGTLYLPPNYKEGDKLPCLLWAYPREVHEGERRWAGACDSESIPATSRQFASIYVAERLCRF